MRSLRQPSMGVQVRFSDVAFFAKIRAHKVRSRNHKTGPQLSFSVVHK